MSTLTTIQENDLPTASRADINDNFAALNADKIETSYIDTDTTLAANSDSKIATQKAVKAYADALLSIFTSSKAGVGTAPASSSTQTVTHTLGRTPVVIRVQAYGDFTADANAAARSSSHGTYNATGNRSVYVGSGTSTANPSTSTSYAIVVTFNNGANTAQGVIQNVGSTSFDIVWTTDADASSDVAFHWEAN